MVDVSSGGRIEPQRSEAVVVVEDDGDAGTVTFAGIVLSRINDWVISDQE